jgi:hypothetical protein
MSLLPGFDSLTGGGGLAVSQNPSSGARDVTNDSKSGSAEGYTGSIVNNFSFGSSQLTSKLGSVGGDMRTLIWVGVGGAVLALVWWIWKKR